MQSQIQKQEKRNEDRRSCHNISLMLGLAMQVGDQQLATAMYQFMLNMVTPVRGQAPN